MRVGERGLCISDCGVGDCITLRTKNTEYTITVTSPGEMMGLVSGGACYPHPTLAMFVARVQLLRGLCFVPFNGNGQTVTSTVQELRLNGESVGISEQSC